MLYSAGLSEGISIPPKVVFYIGSFPVTMTMISALVAVAIVILLAAFIRIFCIPKWNKNIQKVSPLRLLVEAAVRMFDDNAKEQTGRNSGLVGAFYFGAVGLIFFGTLVELLGLRPATTDLNLTFAMGISTFLIIFILGFKEKKVKRLLHYVNPLNIISDVVLPISLALRMFGSVFSGYLIMHLIYSLPWWTTLIGVPAIGNVMFTFFHAIIQSYIFLLLPLNFINEATEIEENHKVKKPKKGKEEELVTSDTNS